MAANVLFPVVRAGDVRISLGLWVKHKYLAHYGINAHREMLLRGNLSDEERKALQVSDDFKLEDDRCTPRNNDGNGDELELGHVKGWKVMFCDEIVASPVAEEAKKNWNVIVKFGECSKVCPYAFCPALPPLSDRLRSL